MRSIAGSVAFFVGTIFMVVIMGGHFGSMLWFVDLPSLMSLVMANATVMIVTGGFKVYVQAMNAVLSKNYVISHGDREKAISLMQLLSKVTMGAGGLFSLLAVIIMLTQLDDLLMVGPMLSIALLTLIYAIVFQVIFFWPVIYILKHRRNPGEVGEKIVISEKLVVNKLMELCYKQGISPEEILEAEEISFKK